jgi:hypothetical protein
MMVAMRRVGTTIVLFGVGWAASACGSSVFVCSSDEQCQGGAGPGVCQPEGYCSFPDERCPSGQRFGDAAPAGVANACVDPVDGTSSGPGPQSSDGVEPPDPSGMQSGSTTTPVAEGSTTMSVAEGSTTGPGPEPTAGMDAESSTTAPVETCTPEIIDPFDGPELLPMWSPFVGPGMELYLDGGRLVFTLAATPDYVVSGTSLYVDSLVGGAARVLISELNDPLLPMGAGIGLGNDVCQLQLALVDGELDALLWDEQQEVITLLANELEWLAPIWLQLRQDEAGEVHFEWSPNAEDWNELFAGSFPECGNLQTEVVVELNVGGLLARDEAGGTRMFDQFEACLP